MDEDISAKNVIRSHTFRDNNKSYYVSFFVGFFLFYKFLNTFRTVLFCYQSPFNSYCYQIPIISLPDLHVASANISTLFLKKMSKRKEVVFVRKKS